MKGDFTRDTYVPANHYSRVLMQQGRVTLDADHNEQASILLHYLRRLARDLIGPYASPVESGGFLLSDPKPDPNGAGFTISAGRMYVDGILVENDSDCKYLSQPDLPVAPDDPIRAEIKNRSGKRFWVYLDVWERHITWVQDAWIREVALNGPDTCTRAQVVWQVKALPSQSETSAPATGASAPYATTPDCTGPLDGLVTISKAGLTAWIPPSKPSTDPCVQSPTSQYRGAENQLYRVEIHNGSDSGQTTFKWSRDNGSVITPWIGLSATSSSTHSAPSQTGLQVALTRGFEAGNWVEVIDDNLELQGKPGALLQVVSVDNGVLYVNPASGTIPSFQQLSNPLLRKWDQTQTGYITLVNGAVPVTETTASNPVWIDLEDGIQVQFSAGGSYRTGDYWLIPARVASGNVEWPSTTDANGNTVPASLPPRGIAHYYAPLGFAWWTQERFFFQPCRCEFDPLSSCFQLGSVAAGLHLLKT